MILFGNMKESPVLCFGEEGGATTRCVRVLLNNSEHFENID